jgi:hypothetical protein
MSGPMDIETILAAAGRAVADGDLTSADALLRDVARAQESTLGPQHPDLATTLNNLAIVAEKTGRYEDAETYYRRAAALAAAALGPDDPMVAETRQNLEDFCSARGLPLSPPVAKMRPSPNPLPARRTVPPAPVPEATTTPAVTASARPTPIPPVSTPPVPTRPAPSAPDLPAIPAANAPHDPAVPSRTWLWATLGVVLLLIAAFFVMRSRTPQDPAEAPATESAPHPAEPERSAPAQSPPASPRDQAQGPAAQPRDQRGAATPPPARGASAEGVTVTHAELCRTFSTRRGAWQCTPAGDVVAPGPLVLYTRIATPRQAAITHHWYRGETSRQSVRLTVHPNGTAGYRTYTRQTVTPGEWRVEVRSAAGDLLHETRFTVR